MLQVWDTRSNTSHKYGTIFFLLLDAITNEKTEKLIQLNITAAL